MSIPASPWSPGYSLPRILRDAGIREDDVHVLLDFRSTVEARMKDLDRRRGGRCSQLDRPGLWTRTVAARVRASGRGYAPGVWLYALSAAVADADYGRLLNRR